MAKSTIVASQGAWRPSWVLSCYHHHRCLVQWLTARLSLGNSPACPTPSPSRSGVLAANSASCNKAALGGSLVREHPQVIRRSCLSAWPSGCKFPCDPRKCRTAQNACFGRRARLVYHVRPRQLRETVRISLSLIPALSVRAPVTSFQPRTIHLDSIPVPSPHRLPQVLPNHTRESGLHDDAVSNPIHPYRPGLALNFP
ncbi:hypothetical protein C8Q73DRAFT_124400 [Cubamyces lactineus]|nr:hypothetical protein C8Q73DRAFT_124400 [Cubamyces lactineus]